MIHGSLSYGVAVCRLFRGFSFLFLVSLLAGVESRREHLLLLGDQILTLLDIVFRLLADFSAATRNVIFAFFRFLADEFASLLARPGRKQKGYDRADTHTGEKESNLCATVVFTHLDPPLPQYLMAKKVRSLGQKASAKRSFCRATMSLVRSIISSA